MNFNNAVNSFRKQRNSEITRFNDAFDTRAQYTTIDGRFPVNNTGEAYKTIQFPVHFSRLPSLTFGFELDGPENITQTRAPVISAEVYDWLYVEDLPVSRMYNGAKILVVSEGASVSKFTVVWSARGIAFTNPRS